MNIKNAKKIVTEISGVVQNWKHYADEVSVDKTKRDEISKTHIAI